jgi:hypothetical protein
MLISKAKDGLRKWDILGICTPGPVKTTGYVSVERHKDTEKPGNYRSKKNGKKWKNWRRAEKLPKKLGAHYPLGRCPGKERNRRLYQKVDSRVFTLSGPTFASSDPPPRTSIFPGSVEELDGGGESRTRHTNATTLSRFPLALAEHERQFSNGMSRSLLGTARMVEMPGR